MTIICKTRSDNTIYMISSPRIETEKAAALLRAGKLVAFPTETVYGLGANALDDKAVAKIYAAKGRPEFNPLITHITGIDEAFNYGKYDPRAESLMEIFWPGALTIILPRENKCTLSLLVSAGLDCIGLRAPKHPLAQALLKRSGVPIAAPSANRSGRVSPTTAQHVAEELGDKVDMILDGGACFLGIESTVLDMTTETPVILRPGSVTKERIEEVIGAVSLVGDGKIKAPGMLESHYAPNAQLRLNAVSKEAGEVLLGFGDIGGEMNLSESGDLLEAAANLFAMLRTLDKNAKRIAIAAIPMEGLGIAINDRLMRAAAPK
jgi:L-threonylcarbamoyladenylate synthase